MRPPAVDILIQRADDATDLPLPSCASDGAACADIYASVPADSPLALAPGDWCAVPCGIIIALPLGWEAQIRPRSGLARKFGITLLNSPGTIDSDYRGEVTVLLINHGRKPFYVERGMRIAQIAFAQTAQPRWQLNKSLPSTARGKGGFGSTGTGEI